MSTLALTTVFFILSTVVVSVFYTLMLVAPRADLTRRVMASLWPIALPALVHVVFALLIVVIARVDVLALWQQLYLDSGFLTTAAVQFIARTYGDNPHFAILHGWVHLLVGDIFMARWAYLDALDRDLPNWRIALTAIAIGLVGPFGVLLYLALRWRRPTTQP